MIVRLLALVPLMALLQGSALADGHYFVDPAAGDDTASGLTPAEAFKTISRAAAEIRTEPPPIFVGQVPRRSVFLAAGVCSQQTGEVFPIELPTSCEVVAFPFAGPGQFIVDAGGAPTAFTTSVGAEVVALSGIEVRGAGVGMDLSMANRLARFSGAIRGCGVAIDARGAPGLQTVSVLTFDGEIEDCSVGIRAQGPWAINGNVTISSCARAGLALDGAAGLFARGEIHSSGVGVLLKAGAAPLYVDLEFCAIFDCDVGVRLLEPSTGRVEGAIEFMTLAGNGEGLRLAPGTAAAGVTIRNSIISGNGADFAAGQGQISIEHTAVPSGAATGPGVLLGAPAFVDPASGDYSLAPGSFGLDHVTYNGCYDVDGDLDGRPDRDLGTYELRTLRRRGTPPSPFTSFEQPEIVPLGTQLLLSSVGTPGSVGLGVVGARAAGLPMGTPFGCLLIERSSLLRLAPFPVDARGYGSWSFTLPADPSLAGTTLALQALMSSPSAPAGAALTNPLVVFLE